MLLKIHTAATFKLRDLKSAPEAYIWLMNLDHSIVGAAAEPDVARLWIQEATMQAQLSDYDRWSARFEDSGKGFQRY